MTCNCKTKSRPTQDQDQTKIIVVRKWSEKGEPIPRFHKIWIHSINYPSSIMKISFIIIFEVWRISWSDRVPLSDDPTIAIIRIIFDCDSRYGLLEVRKIRGTKLGLSFEVPIIRIKILMLLFLNSFLIYYQLLWGSRKVPEINIQR